MTYYSFFFGGLMYSTSFLLLPHSYSYSYLNDSIGSLSEALLAGE